MHRSRSVLVALLTTLGLLWLAPAPAQADEVHPDWGSVTGHDAKVRRGCHGYAYEYAVTPPEGHWALETFLVGPRGGKRGSGYFVTGADPLAGSGSFRLCRRSTPRGTYTIRALLTVDDGFGHVTSSGWLPESTFVLTKRRHRGH